MTRTINPLPFEHLEPKRFEDLVRQLIYDFRSWNVLEATGRSGADEGFDARGIEAGSSNLASPSEFDGDDDIAAYAAPERVWLIQCKREKAIGPTKIVNHLEAIPADSINGLYGLIFVAACDLSKTTRDACREWCRDKGLQEVHVWGRGEIEDLLFQPKNDNLLFGFFGISLQIRQQSVATRIRRRITLKKRIRALQVSSGWPGTPVIFRDPSDDSYPEAEADQWDRLLHRWRPAWIRGAGIHGLRVILRQHYAYYDPATGSWDFATAFNYAYPLEASELWPAPAVFGVSSEVIQAWLALPRQHQVHFRLVGTLPYEDIIEIDQEPDDFCEFPTIFTSFRARRHGEGFEPPFLDSCNIELEVASGSGRPSWDPEKHVRAFPESMRDLEWEAAWSAANNISLSTEPIDLPVSPPSGSSSGRGNWASRWIAEQRDQALP